MEIDIVAILIWSFVSAVVGLIIAKITGHDILGVITVVVVVFVTLKFMYSDFDPGKTADFIVWMTITIVGVFFEAIFSGLITGELFEQRAS